MFDADPDDAFDADDTPADQLRVLQRLVVDLEASSDWRTGARAGWALKIIRRLRQARAVDDDTLDDLGRRYHLLIDAQ
jgi:hypothetical protein